MHLNISMNLDNDCFQGEYGTDVVQTMILAAIDKLSNGFAPNESVGLIDSNGNTVGQLDVLEEAPTILIRVEGGCVTDVDQLPYGWLYKLDDHDVGDEGETEEEYNAR